MLSLQRGQLSFNVRLRTTFTAVTKKCKCLACHTSTPKTMHTMQKPLAPLMHAACRSYATRLRLSSRAHPAQKIVECGHSIHQIAAVLPTNVTKYETDEKVKTPCTTVVFLQIGTHERQTADFCSYLETLHCALEITNNSTVLSSMRGECS